MTNLVTPLPLPRPEMANDGIAIRRSIGAILIDSGRITPEDAERIIRAQRTHGQRFGEAAIQLGLLTEEDIRYALSHQFDYQYLPAGDTSLSESLVAAYQPFSDTVEQLRALRSQLMLRWFDADVRRKALAVMAPMSGTGASFIVSNLAIVFSQLGERTLLIDANLRAPTQHDLFRIEARPGLSDLLSGYTGPSPVVRLSSFMGLSILPAGTVPPNPQELLGREAFKDLIARYSREHDVILIDTPAAGQYADSQIIATRAGAALLVARKNQTSTQQLTRLARDVQQHGSLLVGSVLNDG